MEPSIVDRLHADFLALSEVLGNKVEPSLMVTADDCFRKALLLSAASLFETAILDAIQRFVAEATGGNKCVLEFVRRKGLTRQYHTLFDWDKRHAGPFFSLFGEEFKAAVDARTKTDEQFVRSVAAFLEIGRERNRVVHQNFGHVTLEKTAGEIYELYVLAAAFVAELPDLLRRGGIPPQEAAG